MADYGTYCSIGRLKSDMRVSGVSDEAALLRVLESASRHWDDECGRHFLAATRAAYFDGPPEHVNRWQLWLPVDVLSVSTLKLDLDGDRTYETTLSASDYELVSLRADGQPPYNRIDLTPHGARGSWPTGHRSIEITGVFGYSQESESCETLAAAISTTSTTAVSMAGGHGLTGGETILVDSEQMYVGEIPASNSLVVIRGVNGTTAATHLSGAAVTRRRYPRPIEQATALRAARLWRAGQTGYAAEAAAPELGGYPVAPQVRDELVLVRDYIVRAY